MCAEEMWAAFCQIHPKAAGLPYEAWAFGGAPDELAQLVLAGCKTATSSAYDLYIKKKQPLPQIGEYSVILNSRKEAVCIIRTCKVTILPFREVGETHAYREGEGDRSLAYWQKIHEDFFTKALEKNGFSFSPSSRVVCEEFELLYPQNEYDHPQPRCP